MPNKIAVAGGGASGIMAAIISAQNGAEPVILEKNDRIGRKILSTGNGRCNFTNINADIKNYHGSNTSFLKNTLGKFWVKETMDFFDDLGVLPRVEEDGRVYPYSCQAAAVCDVLRFAVERLGIKTITRYSIKSIEKHKKRFVVCSDKGDCSEYDKVIMALGGMAAPELGTDGFGYEIAKKLGHRIVTPVPSLVQVKTSSVKGLKGIKVQAQICCGDKSSYGEILFTDYGLSGPPVFWISTYAHGEKYVTVDFLPEYTEQQLTEMLKKRSRRGLTLEYMLVGIVNRLVGINTIKYAGIEPLSKNENELCDEELAAIAHALKHRRFNIEGMMSWKNAQVTAGGINTDEVNSKTMESRLVKGLYFAGEILDIDGECGGYNLQWAWSSGYIAGFYASKGRS